MYYFSKSWWLICILIIKETFAECHHVGLHERSTLVFYGPKSSVTYNLSKAVKITQNNLFDNTKKTVLYLHGFNENQQSESVRTIVKAYRTRNDYNLITLDWREDAVSPYVFHAFPNVKKLGIIVAEVLICMFEAGLSLERFHLVGHSLGGQMAGSIGREIQRITENRITLKRISALDPAFPAFYGPFLQHITKNDAEIVDIIHTDAFFYGAPIRTGTVDFWPNGGIARQPGCPKKDMTSITRISLCDHHRSWRFWAESVENRNSSKFNAIKASSWTAFMEGRTDKIDLNIVMGNDCPKEISGNYYLQTNDKMPFARGEQGTKYKDLQES